MKEAGSLVFRDLDFFGLFLELTILRRMDVLAEKLIPWEPMNHEQDWPCWRRGRISRQRDHLQLTRDKH